MGSECGACGDILNKRDFSNKQRQMPEGLMRCKLCISEERPLRVKMCSCPPGQARHQTPAQRLSSREKNYVRWQLMSRSRAAWHTDVDAWNGTGGPGARAYASEATIHARADRDVRSAAEWANAPAPVAKDPKVRERARADAQAKSEAAFAEAGIIWAENAWPSCAGNWFTTRNLDDPRVAEEFCTKLGQHSNWVPPKFDRGTRQDFEEKPFPVRQLRLVAGRNRQGVQGAHLNPLGLSLTPPGPLPTHLRAVYMGCSECLPSPLTPLAERTRFSQAGGGCQRRRVHAGADRRQLQDLHPHASPLCWAVRLGTLP